ncbi:MAG: hypothetical protein L0241_12990 [Planctomycetia bacterium]|nr:hypothetical protein [Planctomycetia bacterium]
MRVFRGDLRHDVDRLAFGPGVRLAASAVRSNQVDVWDAVTGIQADAWSARGCEVTDLGFLPTGQVLVCVTGHPLQVIDPEAERYGLIFPGAESKSLDSAVLVATGGDRVFVLHAQRRPFVGDFTLAAWKPVAGGKYKVEWQVGIDQTVAGIAASEHGLVAVATQSTSRWRSRVRSDLILYDAATGVERAKITERAITWGRADRLRFFPDGERVLALASGIVHVWETARGNHLGQFPARLGSELLTDVAVHPSGKVLFTSGEDHRARLWDATTFTELTAWEWSIEKLHSIAVSADGALAAVGGETGRIVVWDLDL